MLTVLLGAMSTADNIFLFGIVIVFWILPLAIAILTVVNLLVPGSSLRKIIYTLSALPLGLGAWLLIVHVINNTLKEVFEYGAISLFMVPLLVVIVCCLTLWYHERKSR